MKQILWDADCYLATHFTKPIYYFISFPLNKFIVSRHPRPSILFSADIDIAMFWNVNVTRWVLWRIWLGHGIGEQNLSLLVRNENDFV